MKMRLTVKEKIAEQKSFIQCQLMRIEDEEEYLRSLQEELKELKEKENELTST